MTVLIADDNDRFRQLLRSLLEGRARIVAEARNGVEAVQDYQAHRPDWVLMDVRMTMLDGLKATAQILAGSPEARVLIVSHYDDEQTRVAAREVGACGFVSKENVAGILDVLGLGHAPGSGNRQHAARLP
jgi:CheY-like chemotaxis protein